MEVEVEVVIVSVMAVKLWKLVSGKMLGCINDVLKELSCPSIGVTA